MNIYLVGGAVRDQLLGLAVKAQIETPRMAHVFNVCLNQNRALVCKRAPSLNI